MRSCLVAECSMMRTVIAVLMAAITVASCAESEVTRSDLAGSGSVAVGEVVGGGSSGAELAPIASTAASVPVASADVIDIAAVLSGDLARVGDEFEVNVAIPVTIRIPSIYVDAPVIGLELLDDGSIEVPDNTTETGWWRDGPEPGEQGPAVILGHVDSQDGPAVFYRLKQLTTGDQIHVDRQDGTTVTFAVDSTERHSKDAFPAEAVYGATDRPTLRLVTCGGAFDRSARSYVDNFIVFASLA